MPPLSIRYAGHYAASSLNAAGLIVISAFFARLFSYLFFQLITASRLLAPRARGFLSVIFPPPGNYVGAADQTREEADAALKKSRFAYLNPVCRINGERRRTKRKERARREDRAKKGCVPSQATLATKERDRERRGRVRHDNGPCLHTRKLADAEKAADYHGMRQKLLGKRKKNSQREND